MFLWDRFLEMEFLGRRFCLIKVLLGFVNLFFICVLVNIES